jgi:hypothetical protein
MWHFSEVIRTSGPPNFLLLEPLADMLSHFDPLQPKAATSNRALVLHFSRDFGNNPN